MDRFLLSLNLILDNHNLSCQFLSRQILQNLIDSFYDVILGLN